MKMQEDDQASVVKDKSNKERPKVIIFNEESDILSKYRIPYQINKVDRDLQLPEDSDSSAFSSEKD
jgi:hypothetical protein